MSLRTETLGNSTRKTLSKIELTQGQFTLVDAADFSWLSQWKWNATKSATGKFYARRRTTKAERETLNMKSAIEMQRLILGVHPHLYADHIDGDTLNNQRSNLRLVTLQQNGFNRALGNNSTTGYKGVYKRPRRECNPYQAGIKVGGLQMYIGSYSTAEEAALAYNLKAIELHGEFANLNVIPNV